MPLGSEEREGRASVKSAASRASEEGRERKGEKERKKEGGRGKVSCDENESDGDERRRDDRRARRTHPACTQVRPTR